MIWSIKSSLHAAGSAMATTDGTIITVSAIPITAVWAAYFAFDMSIEYAAFLVAALCAVCGSLLLPSAFLAQGNMAARTGVILISAAGVIAGVSAVAEPTNTAAAATDDALFEVAAPVVVVGGFALAFGIAFVGAGILSFIDGARTKQFSGSFPVFALAFLALALGTFSAVADVEIWPLSPLTLSYAPTALAVLSARYVLGLFWKKEGT